MQGPLEEVLGSANVLVALLKEHNQVALVRVELALSVILQLLEVHVPLSGEQRNALEVGHSIGVAVLKLTRTSEALVDERVAVDASDDDLMRHVHFVE